MLIRLTVNFRFLLLFVLFPASHAQAAFHYQDLEGLLAHKKPESIEALLAELPKNYLRNATFIYHSYSLQAASYQNPRAILFGTDGELILTFNGHPEQSGFQNIEIMRWLREEAKFELRELSFPSGGGTPSMSEANPARCLQCHASAPKPFGEPKPIWDMYPFWPGVYGSVEDTIRFSRRLNPIEFGGNVAAFDRWTELRIEAEEFMKFRESGLTHARYQHILAGTEDTFPYNVERDFLYQVNTDFNLAPNTRLGMILHGLNTKRLWRKLLEHPLYLRNPTQFTYLALCRVRPQDRTFAKHRFFADYTIYPEVTYDYSSRSLYRRLLGTDAFGLKFIKQNRRFFLVENKFGNSVGLYGIDDEAALNSLLITESRNIGLLPPIEEEEELSTIQSKYSDPRYYNYLEGSIAQDFLSDSYIGSVPFPKLPSHNECYALLQKLRRQIRSRTPENPEAEALVQSFAGKAIEQKEFFEQKPTRHCSGCHTLKDSTAFAPYIPFNDDNLLADHLRKGLFEAIEKRTLPNSSTPDGYSIIFEPSMPLGRYPLTPVERAELLRYLRALMESRN